MNDRQKRIIEKLGLKEEQFNKHDKNADIEMAIIELAEVVDNAITEHENALVEVANMLAEMEG